MWACQKKRLRLKEEARWEKGGGNEKTLRYSMQFLDPRQAANREGLVSNTFQSDTTRKQARKQTTTKKS